MNRRELLKSFAKPFTNDTSQPNEILRPPYSKGSDDIFKDTCIKCENKNCAKVCQENIILIQEDGTPKLEFAISGCTYCDECAKACNYGILDVADKQNFNIRFVLDSKKCISWDNTICFACKDPCLENAINFNGMFNPDINNIVCTSCGFCIAICPSNAISFKTNIK